MESQSVRTNRMHPLVAGAAVAVTAVSLLGMAAITGVISPSHGMVPNAGSAPAEGVAPNDVARVAPRTGSNGRRYRTSDGQVLEVVSPNATVTPVADVQEASSATRHRTVATPAPVVHRHQVHHYTQPTFHAQQQQYVQDDHVDAQPVYPPHSEQPVQAHPVMNYVNDMHPVGTGVGAVVGGLLGNQIGGGNGKKIATLAGVLLGGYTGNEVAHNRNPLN